MFISWSSFYFRHRKRHISDWSPAVVTLLKIDRRERERGGSAYYVLGALVKCLGALVKCLAGWGEVFWGSERWEKKGFWISLLNGNILQIHMPQLFTVQLNIYSPRTTFTWLSKKLNCKELTCMHLGWVNHYNIKKLQSWIFIHYSAVVAFVLSAKCCLVSLIFLFVCFGRGKDLRGVSFQSYQSRICSTHKPLAQEIYLVFLMLSDLIPYLR